MSTETQGDITILISDADEAVRSWLRQQLKGYRLIEAESGAEALSATSEKSVDILLTASKLPDMSGLELCERLTQGPGRVRPSVVVLSAQPDMATLQAAYGAGASGVLPISSTGVELHNAIQMALKVRTIEEQIGKLFREFQRLADTDPLTQLPNRRYLENASSRELSRAERTGEPLAVLLLDIDGFKLVNDRLGHEVGDDVLTGFAQLVRTHLRNHDILVRYGGDEFVAVLPATSSRQARHVAEKLRNLVAETHFTTAQGPVQFTISIGIAMWDPSQPSLDTTIRHADVALYRSKQKGRNRTTLMSPSS
jgi:two-component system, cell cycle response regulator